MLLYKGPLSYVGITSGSNIHRLATARWLSSGTQVSSTNETDCHDITEILLKVALNTIKLNQTFNKHMSTWKLVLNGIENLCSRF